MSLAIRRGVGCPSKSRRSSSQLTWRFPHFLHFPCMASFGRHLGSRFLHHARGHVRFWQASTCRRCRLAASCVAGRYRKRARTRASNVYRARLAAETAHPFTRQPVNVVNFDFSLSLSYDNSRHGRQKNQVALPWKVAGQPARANHLLRDGHPVVTCRSACSQHFFPLLPPQCSISSLWLGCWHSFPCFSNATCVCVTAPLWLREPFTTRQTSAALTLLWRT